MAKIVALDVPAFLDHFKKKVITPLKNKLTKIAWPKISELLHSLEHELPGLLYGWVTFEESKKGVSGAEKYNGVLLRFSKWMALKGYGAFTPVLIPLIESAVRMIYRGVVESAFEKWGIEDAFEKWLGIDIGKEHAPIPTASTPATSPAS